MYFHMDLVAVVVVDDFDSGFVDFGCGGGMMFDFFFSSVGLVAVVVDW